VIAVIGKAKFFFTAKDAKGAEEDRKGDGFTADLRG
jgi:hypothetical protein